MQLIVIAIVIVILCKLKVHIRNDLCRILDENAY